MDRLFSPLAGCQLHMVIESQGTTAKKTLAIPATCGAGLSAGQ